MQASEFEFRHRFWLFGAVYWVGFGCYAFDHRSTAGWLVSLARGGEADLAPLTLRHALQLAFALGVALVAAAAALRTWASAYLASERVHDSALRSEALVADGPYRHLRNPLYLGTILMAVGIGLAASRTGFAVIVAGTLVGSLRLIGREEAALLAAQGEGYAAYLRAVPRLWPALRPRLPAGGVTPRWGQAWAGETFVWGLALALAVFAATLNLRVFGLACLALVVLYAAMGRIWKRLRRREGR